MALTLAWESCCSEWSGVSPPDSETREGSASVTLRPLIAAIDRFIGARIGLERPAPRHGHMPGRRRYRFAYTYRPQLCRYELPEADKIVQPDASLTS